MGRLTEKINDFWVTNNKANVYYLDKNESVFIGNAIDRLAEFEDFMEENGFESFEEFKKHFDIWNLEDDEAFIKDTDKWKLWGYRFVKNRFRYEMEENQALKDRWEKLKEIISNKQHIKDKATDFVTLLGASGVEIFCEMLLKEMQELEKKD